MSYQIFLTGTQNCKPVSDIHIGFAAKNQFAAIVKKKKVDDSAQNEFRNECLKFPYSVTEEILEWSPLKCKLVCNLYCLVTNKMVSIPDDGTEAPEVVLNKLVEAEWKTNKVSGEILNLLARTE